MKKSLKIRFQTTFRRNNDLLLKRLVFVQTTLGENTAIGGVYADHCYRVENQVSINKKMKNKIRKGPESAVDCCIDASVANAEIMTIIKYEPKRDTDTQPN